MKYVSLPVVPDPRRHAPKEYHRQQPGEPHKTRQPGQHDPMSEQVADPSDAPSRQ